MRILAAACREFAPNDAQCVCINNAVFVRDSAWATANNADGTPSVGKRMNNPGNVRCLGDNSPVPSVCTPTKNNGSFAKFDSLEDGVRANVDLYARLYAGKGWTDLTNTWAQTKSKEYHEAVGSCFNSD